MRPRVLIGSRISRSNLAVNCVAGSIPAAFLLMIDGNIGRVVLLKSLMIGIIFSNAIGFPARFVIPRLYPGIARRGLPGNGPRSRWS
jgi:uncharacterized membrane protein